MFKSLQPRMTAESVFTIDYEKLRKKGVKALLFDIDNTIVPFDDNAPTDEHVKLFAKLREMGFALCFLSNNRSNRRGAAFANVLGAKYVAGAKKPAMAGMVEALTMTGAKPKETALIGDQLFTDVWCANRCGVLSILVEPVDRERDEWFVKLKRVPEAIVMSGFKKRGK